jgi:hypothetical protein
MHKLRLSAFLTYGLLALLLSCSIARADELYGKIRGTVTDPTGAVVPNASITVTNVGTGVSKTTTSSATGYYEVPQLLVPGTYKVTVEASGFKKYEAAGIPLHVNEVYVADVSLEVGPLTQRVTVEAAPVQVEKTSMELGVTISGNEIVDMPLNGRNWIALQQTLPGVVAAADARGNFATNGSETEQNSFLVNGVDTNDLPLNTPLVIPSPDAIAEFHMVTNTINPEYGRNSGAILNAVTKSGSNSFHGSGFDFFRDTSLNARNFFLPKPSVFHQNQFGGTIGGPVWKNHTFFFFSYQGRRTSAAQAGGTVTVFTPDQRNGIFGAGAVDCSINVSKGQTPDANCPTSPFPMVGDASSTCAPAGTPCPAGTRYGAVWDISNPSSPVLIPSAGPGLFSTGSIPTVNFNSLSTSLLSKFVPLPNVGTEYTFNPVTTSKADQYLTRMDHTFSSKDAIWGSWYWQSTPSTDTLPFTGATLPGFPERSQSHIQEYVLAWNHTLNSTTLNEARVGYTRLNFVAVQPVSPLDPKSVGFTGINVQDPAISSWPKIDLSGGGYFILGFSNNGPQPRIDQTYQVDDNFTKMLGRHTFKLGFNMRRFQVYNPFAFSLNGNFAFGASGAYTTGDAAADFLLGMPDSYAQGGKDIISARSQEYYSYFQDQFKIRPNLTLTYGTGWSVDTPLIDNYHANHAGIAIRPGQQSTVYSNAPLGYVFQGDSGINAFGTTKYNHFGPRLGFAYSPGKSGKWAIRGGYGIYFNKALEEQTLQFLGSPPFALISGGAADYSTATVTYSPSFAAPFTDIAGGGTFPNKFPVPVNPASNADFSPFLPMSIEVVDPNITDPYGQNYNLTVERQLSGTTLVSVAYVGALGRKLILTRELNPGRNPSGCAADPNCVAKRVYQNILYPQNYALPGTTYGSIYNDQSTGVSNYNALQATFDKRMSHGLSFYAAYTWSHAMDDGSGFENSTFGGGGFGAYGNTRLTDPFNQTLRDYGPSEYDATHRLVMTYTYEIPPVHHFSNWAAKRLAEGWRMSGGTTFQVGFPLDVVDTGFRSLTCDAWTFEGVCPDIPNVVSRLQYADPRTSTFVNGTKGGTTSNTNYWFNPNTFSREAMGTFGNAGRNPLRGPGINNFDLGFYKDTHITEQTRIELRFEFFNLFNHTQFSPNSLNTNINSVNFGRDLSARDPRIIQLAAKFYF